MDTHFPFMSNLINCFAQNKMKLITSDANGIGDKVIIIGH